MRRLCCCWSVVWCAFIGCGGSVFVFFFALLCVRTSFAIILKRKRELVALRLLSYGCRATVNVLWLFLTVPWVGLRCVIVVFPDYIHLLFMLSCQIELVHLYEILISCADSENSVSVESFFFIHKRISQLTEEGPIAIPVGSAPVLLGKPIATCVFPKEYGPLAPPPPPSVSRPPMKLVVVRL